MTEYSKIFIQISWQFPQYESPVRYLLLAEAREVAVRMEGEHSLREAEAQSFTDEEK